MQFIQLDIFCLDAGLNTIDKIRIMLIPFRIDTGGDFFLEFLCGFRLIRLIPGNAFFTLQDELSQMLGETVELHTPGFLSRYFRDEVMAQATVLFR